MKQLPPDSLNYLAKGWDRPHPQVRRIKEYCQFNRASVLFESSGGFVGHKGFEAPTTHQVRARNPRVTDFGGQEGCDRFHSEWRIERSQAVRGESERQQLNVGRKPIGQTTEYWAATDPKQ